MLCLLLLRLRSILLAVSDRQSNSVGEAGCPSQVVGELPQLGAEKRQKKMGLADTARCERGWKEPTPKHVLQVCPPSTKKRVAKSGHTTTHLARCVVTNYGRDTIKRQPEVVA